MRTSSTLAPRSAALLVAALLVAALPAVAAPSRALAAASSCETLVMTSPVALAVVVGIGDCGTMGDGTHTVSAVLVERRSDEVVRTWGPSSGYVSLLADEQVPVEAGGWYDLTVTNDSDSGGEQVQTAEVLVDDGGLVTISRPVVAFRPGGMSGSSFPGFVDWERVGDTAAARYVVQRRLELGAWTAVDKATASRLDVTLAAGSTVEFRVRGVDANGTPGPWRATLPWVPTGVGDGSPDVAYGGTWRTRSDHRYWGGSAHAAKAAGRTATFAFDGGAAAVVVRTGPNQGSFRVRVDGVARKVVKTVSPGNGYKKVVYSIWWTTEGSHEITVEVLGTAGHPWVDVDGFLVLVAPKT